MFKFIADQVLALVIALVITLGSLAAFMSLTAAQEVNVSTLPHATSSWAPCGRRCVHYVCASINQTSIDVRITRQQQGGRYFGSGRNRRGQVRGQHKTIQGAPAETAAFMECTPLGKNASAVTLKLVQDNCDPLQGLFQAQPTPQTSFRIDRSVYGTTSSQTPPNFVAPGCEHTGTDVATGQRFGGSLVILPDGYAFGTNYVSVSNEKHVVFYSGSRNQALGGGVGSPMQIAQHYTRIWELQIEDPSSRRR